MALLFLLPRIAFFGIAFMGMAFVPCIPAHAAWPAGLWVQLGGYSGVEARHLFGTAFTVGQEFKGIAVDMRISLAAGEYGAISVLPDAADASAFASHPAGSDPSSEINRLRLSNESWSYFLYGPGLSVKGRVFKYFWPWLYGKGRAGFSYGSYSDSANALGFTALEFTPEASLQARLGANSRWWVDLSGTLHWGRLKSKTVPEQIGALPVSYLTTSLSLIYSF